MEALTIEGLRTLVSEHEEPCVSVYLPVHRGRGPEDQDKLAGLLRRTREHLERRSGKRIADRMLAPVEKLRAANGERPAETGLALFLAPGFHVEYRLPVEVPEMLLVGDSFHIRPLLQFLETNQHYFVLALSRGDVRFFKGSAHGVVPAAVPDLPRSLDDALGQEERERSVTFHSGAPGDNAPIFGGGGKADTSRDEDRARFHRAVDRALWNVLRDERAPLIVAASDREGALFRTITRYRHLAPRLLGPDVARATLPSIHERAWPLVQEIVREREGDVLERYERLVSRGRSLDELRGIAKLAIQGRVSDLLVERGASLWGRFDRANGELALFGDRGDESEEDVLDDLAEAVLLRGGEVWSFERERMPSKSPVAALLRW